MFMHNDVEQTRVLLYFFITKIAYGTKQYKLIYVSNST